jgi:hypothetical protein
MMAFLYLVALAWLIWIAVSHIPVALLGIFRHIRRRRR